MNNRNRDFQINWRHIAGGMVVLAGAFIGWAAVFYGVGAVL